MLTPFQKASEFFDDEVFCDNVMWCAAFGFLHSDSECFVAAELINHDLLKIESKQLVEIKSKKRVDIGDTWMIYMVAGNMKRAFEIIEPAKYIVFERFDGKFRRYDFERMRRLYG